MTPPEPDLSPLSVVVALLTLFVGPQLAPALGAYSLILIAWFGGVLIGVYRLPPAPRGVVAVFVIVSLIVTLGITVPAADLLARYMPLLDAKGLMFPIAVLIPAVGYSWLAVGAWVWSLRTRFITSSNKEGQQ